jgi:hypothetical protein
MHRPQNEHRSGNFTQATLRLPIVSRVISLELQALTHLPQPVHRAVSTIIERLPSFIFGC